MGCTKPLVDIARDLFVCSIFNQKSKLGVVLVKSCHFGCTCMHDGACMLYRPTFFITNNNLSGFATLQVAGYYYVCIGQSMDSAKRVGARSMVDLLRQFTVAP